MLPGTPGTVTFTQPFSRFSKRGHRRRERLAWFGVNCLTGRDRRARRTLDWGIMTAIAYMEKVPGGSCETRMRFPVGRAKAGETEITVHNISEWSLVLEGDVPLELGLPIDVKLPHSGAVRAHVAWVSGRLAGLDFAVPISRISLGAARLQGAVALAPEIAGTARYKESFGLRVQRLRLAKSMSQRDLARKMAVSDAAVCGWELNRTRPKPPRMQELATILDVSLAELLGQHGANSLQAQIASAREAIATTARISENRVRIQIDH